MRNAFRQFSSVFGCALLMFVSASNLNGQQVSAPIPAPTTPEEAARNLLNPRWEKNRENRTNSKVELDSYSRNEDVLLAYTLNRMQHRRMREALESARTLTSVAPENLDGVVLRIWLETFTDNFDSAVLELTELGKRLSAAQDISLDDRKLALKRTGRVVGYLQGPGLNDTDPDMLESAILSMTNGIDQQLLDIFNKNRNEVLTTFEDLSQAKSKKETDEKKRVVDKNAAETEAINKRNEEIVQRKEKLAPKVDEVRNEGYEKLEKVKNEALPLQTELSSLKSQINTVQFSLDSLYLNLAFARDFERRSINGNRNRGYNPRYAAIGSSAIIWNEIRNRTYQLDILRSQFRGVSNQLAFLEEQGMQIRNQYESSLNQLNNELDGLDDVRRKNDRRLNKLAKDPKIAVGKIESLRNRLYALKTYDPISLEVYRRRALAELN